MGPVATLSGALTCQRFGIRRLVRREAGAIGLYQTATSRGYESGNKLPRSKEGIVPRLLTCPITSHRSILLSHSSPGGYAEVKPILIVNRWAIFIGPRCAGSLGVLRPIMLLLEHIQ